MIEFRRIALIFLVSINLLGFIRAIANNEEEKARHYEIIVGIILICCAINYLIETIEDEKKK